MEMGKGIQEFQNRLSTSSDEELKALGSINLSQYRDEFVELIRNEINKRGFADDIQNIIFDHFGNGDGWAGRLILLEEQLLFLSIGQEAKSISKSGGGVVGALGGSVKDADRAQQITHSKNSDFSALENAGSWLCYLDEIVGCEAESSWISGKNLKIRFILEGEEASTKTVKFEEFSKVEINSLNSEIVRQKDFHG